MVDWKKKYLKMKINYINTKNKFNGGALIVPESPRSNEIFDELQDKKKQQQIAATIASLDKSGIPNQINSLIGDSLKYNLVCKELEEKFNEWLVPIKIELEGQSFNKELYFKVFRSRDYLYNLQKQLKISNCDYDYKDLEILVDFLNFSVEMVLGRCSNCFSRFPIVDSYKKDGVVRGLCFNCRDLGYT